MNTIDQLKKATIRPLKTLIGATDGTRNMVNFKAGIAHAVRSSIPQQIIMMPSLPTIATETEAFMIPVGTMLPDVFGFLGSYKNLKLTQHQILDYVTDNWDTVRKDGHAVAFVTETEMGYCFFYLTVFVDQEKFLVSLVPVTEAEVPINDELAMVVVPKTN